MTAGRLPLVQVDGVHPGRLARALNLADANPNPAGSRAGGGTWIALALAVGIVVGMVLG